VWRKKWHWGTLFCPVSCHSTLHDRRIIRCRYNMREHYQEAESQPSPKIIIKTFSPRQVAIPWTHNRCESQSTAMFDTTIGYLVCELRHAFDTLQKSFDRRAAQYKKQRSKFRKSCRSSRQDCWSSFRSHGDSWHIQCYQQNMFIPPLTIMFLNFIGKVWYEEILKPIRQSP
jgi:hypothetical protein